MNLHALWVKVKFFWDITSFEVTWSNSLLNLTSSPSAHHISATEASTVATPGHTRHASSIRALPWISPWEHFSLEMLFWQISTCLILSSSLHLYPRAYSVKPNQTIQCKTITWSCPSSLKRLSNILLYFLFLRCYYLIVLYAMLAVYCLSPVTPKLLQSSDFFVSFIHWYILSAQKSAWHEKGLTKICWINDLMFALVKGKYLKR